MISYTLTPYNPDTPWAYALGFKVADIDDVERIAKGISRYVWSGIAWEDGHRCEDNFLYSDWCVLDFEDPEYTLSQALNDFCDCAHIIGTTKSHQKEKNGTVCDHFRVALKWSQRINDIRLYRWNMQRMCDRYPIDPKALDGARYFFPCQDIVSVAKDGLLWDISEIIPDNFEPAQTHDEYQEKLRIKSKLHAISGRFPPWMRDFFREGKTVGDGRNYTCFRVALELLEMGYGSSEVVQKINAAPFPRTDWRSNETEITVASAMKQFLKNTGRA